MIEKLEILRISFLDVDIGRCGSVSVCRVELFQFKAPVGTKDA